MENRIFYAFGVFIFGAIFATSHIRNNPLVLGMDSRILYLMAFVAALVVYFWSDFWSSRAGILSNPREAEKLSARECFDRFCHDPGETGYPERIMFGYKGVPDNTRIKKSLLVEKPGRAWYAYLLQTRNGDEKTLILDARMGKKRDFPELLTFRELTKRNDIAWAEAVCNYLCRSKVSVTDSKIDQLVDLYETNPDLASEFVKGQGGGTS